jgi:hypothetical protein
MNVVILVTGLPINTADACSLVRPVGLTLDGYFVYRKQATDWTARVRFPALQDSFFSAASRPTLGPAQPYIQWVPGALSLGVKWKGFEADDWPPSSAVKKSGALPPLPHMSSSCALLIKHRKKKKTPWLWSASEPCRPSDRRFLAK